MKVLVTGGCGFIGSHLVDRLILIGHDVVVLDNLSTGKKENLNKAAKFISGDVRNQTDVNKAAKDCKVIFHLAAIADVQAGEDAVFQTNFIGSTNVFKCAEKNKAKTIFTSSAAVYGDGKLPCNEDDTCKPVSQYGKSKLKAENLLKKQSDYFILRLFNVYGPRGYGVANNFCGKIPEYRDITIFGNGLQTRDFVFVNDVVDALLLGADNTGIYNAGTGKETSLLQLVDIIHNVSKAKPSVRFLPEKKGEIKRSKADISKIKKLGWKPKFSLEEGVLSVLNSSGFLPR